MTKSKGIGRGNNPNSHKGHKNLIPTPQRSIEEAKEIGRKGGLAASAARAKKKEAQTFADAFLHGDASDWSPDEVRAYCQKHNLICTLENAMNARIALKALKDGDVMAYTASMNRMCGPPIQRTEVQIVDDSKVNNVKKKLRDNPGLIEELFGDEDE